MSSNNKKDTNKPNHSSTTKSSTNSPNTSANKTSPKPQNTQQKVATKQSTESSVKKADTSNAQGKAKPTATNQNKTAAKTTVKTPNKTTEKQANEKSQKKPEQKIETAKGHTATPSQPPKNNNNNSHDNKSGNGLTIAALLAGLGGLGLSGYQYLNPVKTDLSGVEQQISSLTETNSTLKSELGNVKSDLTNTLTTTVDEKVTALSAKVADVAKTVSAQPSADALTQSVTESVSESVGQALSEGLTQRLTQQFSESLASTTTQLKSDVNDSTTALIDAQVKTFSNELAGLRSQVSTLVEAGVADLNTEDLQNAQATINGRVDKAFQDLTETKTTQLKSIAEGITQAATEVQSQVVDEREQFDNALAKVNTRIASGQRDFALSEVDYLLSMAARKVSIEHAPTAAVDLLNDAKTTLSRIDASGIEAFSNDIDKQVSTLQSLKTVDKKALFAELNNANSLVSTLTAKSAAKAEAKPEPTGSITERLSNALKSSVVEIPKDPNAIKITPESAEYARQNVALNLNFIKYAVATDDQALLSSNLTALADNLNVAFADDEALQQLKAVQARLKDVNLDITYPDLSPLLNSFKLLNQALSGAGES